MEPMAHLIDVMDWAATPLGARETWPVSLRVATGMVVRSALPQIILWGPELTQIYNDAYAPIAGIKHPAALGQANRVCWPEVSEFNEPVYAQVLQGASLSFQRQKLTLQRKDSPDDAWFDLTYTPLCDDDGVIAGLLATVIEVTDSVRSAQALEQSQRSLHALVRATTTSLYRIAADWSEIEQLEGHAFLSPMASVDRRGQTNFITPEDQEQVRAAAQAAIADKTNFELEHRVTLPDGSVKWAFSRAVPIRVEDGSVQEWLGASTDITEHKESLERLRLADQRIQMALDAGAVAGTWFWDVPADRFTADARFARSFSLDPHLLAQGTPLAHAVQSIHPDDVDRVQQLIQEALAKGSRYSADYRVVQADGTYQWVEANGHVTFDDEGKPLTFPGVLIDIEQRKRREQRQEAMLQLGDGLRDVEQPEEAALFAAGIVCRTLNTTRAGYGTIDSISASVHIASDWRRSEDVASVAGHYRFADYGTYMQDLERGRTVAIADIREDPRTSAHSSSFEALQIRALLNVPITTRNGMVGVFLAHHDRPHRWSTEEVDFVREVADRTWAAMVKASALLAVRDMNQNLEQIATEMSADRNRLWQLSKDIMLVMNLEGRAMAVNPAWKAVLGWEEDGLLGADVFGLLHPEDSEFALASIQQTVESRVAVSAFESRFRCRDGSYRWLSWNVGWGEGIVIGVGRDITAEKQRAAALQQAEERLRQSQKMQAVGQLTGGIAHDFNNSLASISGSLELLKLYISQGKFKDLQRYTRIALDAVQRSASLTQRLLAFSRQQTLDPKATDVNRLIQEMQELLPSTLGPAIRLEVIAEPRLWVTLVDPNQLENALLNLCINARDAMPEGGSLQIRTANLLLSDTQCLEYDLPQGDYVALSVTDTGTGMSPEVAASAFDPFFTTKPPGQGTGLGLSMIYGFARQSGGHVHFDSTPGKGTHMRLLLPRHQGMPAREDDPGISSIDGRPIQRGITVLVVEDEAPLRYLISELLAGLGYTTLDAADGYAAMQFIQSNLEIDLMVTDVGLVEGMNGAALATAARKLRPALKVMFITGYDASKVIEAQVLDQDTQIMTKPFALEDFAGRVRGMLDARP